MGFSLNCKNQTGKHTDQAKVVVTQQLYLKPLRLFLMPYSLSASSASCTFFIDKIATARTLITAPASDLYSHVPCSAALEEFEPVFLSFTRSDWSL